MKYFIIESKYYNLKQGNSIVSREVLHKDPRGRRYGTDNNYYGLLIDLQRFKPVIDWVHFLV